MDYYRMVSSSVKSITSTEMHRVQDLAYKHACITICDTKEEFIRSRIAKRMRMLSINTVSEYCDQVDSGSESIEDFTNLITTNHTQFYREKHHFDLLVRHIENSNPDNYTVWSCACSTGEEPYTIVFTLLENIRSYLDSGIGLIASDLDTSVLEVAKNGIYSMDSLNELSKEQINSYFIKGIGTNTGNARVKRILRERVEFRNINLGTPLPLKKRINAIFCRNVIIYFNKETKHRIFESFAQLQEPGDILFLGHSEYIGELCPYYKCYGQTTYVRC